MFDSWNMSEASVLGCRDLGNNGTQIHPGWGPWIYLPRDPPAVPMLFQLLDPLWPHSTAARTSYWRKKIFCTNWMQGQLSWALDPQNLLIGLECIKKTLFFYHFPSCRSCFKALTYCYKDAQNGTGKLSYHMACEVERTTTNSRNSRTTGPRAWENH